VRDYEKLAYFFPGIELKPIEDLEKFHKGVKNIIEKQKSSINGHLKKILFSTAMLKYPYRIIGIKV
ncbi:MAG: hypothetical protein J6U18_05785, partial [Acetobacter sp.]|nr:hypothetical protein [Acetobacter sp.]